MFAIVFVMAAIPYGAFSACKAMKRAEPETDLKVSRNESYEPKMNRRVLEYTPVKYNGKMMNRWVVGWDGV